MDPKNSLKVKIRKAVREDCVAIMDLKKELAVHQNMGDKPMLSPRDLERDGFDVDPPCFYCIVAEIQPNASSQNENDNKVENEQIVSSRVVGYALYFYGCAVWEGKALHLEDLCVTSKLRSGGIGEKLVKELAKIAVAEQCARIQFEVLDWNPARKFYDRLGGWNTTEGEGWHNFRLGADQIKVLAGT